MRILKRFFHLARADAHGVLDALESRRLTLKQHLRDAELELERKRGTRESLRDALERLERRRNELGSRREALDGDVRLAIERQQETLARFAIRRWLATRKLEDRLQVDRVELVAELERIEGLLRAQEATHRELALRVEAELTELRAREASRVSGEASCEDDARGSHASLGVLDEEVELEWLRRVERAERVSRAEDESVGSETPAGSLDRGATR